MRHLYRFRISDGEHGKFTAEIASTSELNARIRLLAHIKDFGSGDIKRQRENLQNWRERYIIEVHDTGVTK